MDTTTPRYSTMLSPSVDADEAPTWFVIDAVLDEVGGDAVEFCATRADAEHRCAQLNSADVQLNIGGLAVAAALAAFKANDLRAAREAADLAATAAEAAVMLAEVPQPLREVAVVAADDAAVAARAEAGSLADYGTPAWRGPGCPNDLKWDEVIEAHWWAVEAARAAVAAADAALVHDRAAATAAAWVVHGALLDARAAADCLWAPAC